MMDKALEVLLYVFVKIGSMNLKDVFRVILIADKLKKVLTEEYVETDIEGYDIEKQTTGLYNEVYSGLPWGKVPVGAYSILNILKEKSKLNDRPEYEFIFKALDMSYNYDIKTLRKFNRNSLSDLDMFVLNTAIEKINKNRKMDSIKIHEIFINPCNIECKERYIIGINNNKIKDHDVIKIDEHDYEYHNIKYKEENLFKDEEKNN
jgi:hypothetical protein